MHLQNLKRFFGDLPEKKVLDVGCGIGKFLEECKAENINAVGFDSDPNHVENCKKRLNISSVFTAQAENILLEDESFDFINCTGTLEHTNDPTRVLKECYRVLKKGGKMFITVCNKYAIKDPHYELWFLNWLPKKLKLKYSRTTKAKKIIESYDKKRRLFRKQHTRQGIDELNYHSYREFKRLAKEIGFKEVADARIIQLNNPEMILNKKLRKFAWLLRLIYKLTTLFWQQSFHFILTK